jgi:hypothetical protein
MHQKGEIGFCSVWPACSGAILNAFLILATKRSSFASSAGCVLRNYPQLLTEHRVALMSIKLLFEVCGKAVSGRLLAECQPNGIKKGRWMPAFGVSAKPII